MHRTGHYGAALAVYAPVGAVLVAAGLVELALVGGGVAVAGAMLPDYDLRVPGISHRGITHTVWFALAVGGVLAVVGAAVGNSRTGPGAAAVFGAFGLLVGVVTVGAHVLADALTPMGVQPFAPLDDTTYSFDVTTAANPVANYALLALGVVLAGAGAAAGNAVANALGT